MERTLAQPLPLAAIAMTALVITLSANSAVAAPDQATQDKCAAYAKHAVEQYQLMKSHPGCDAHLDALSWRDDYGYHYNGCIVFGNGATTLSDQARDGHLRACGAITDATPATPNATPAAAPPSSATGGSTGAVAAPTPNAVSTAAPAATSGTPPSAANPASSLVSPAAGYGGIGCHTNPSIASQVSGAGLVADLKGNVLTYHASPAITSQTSAQATATIGSSLGQYPLVTAIVTRPQTFPSCKGIPPVSALGPWVAAAGLGQPPRYIWVNVGGELSWQQITPDAAKALITGANSTPTASTKSQAATPSAAPPKPVAPTKSTH